MAQTVQVDPALLKTLKMFGAFDVSACFDCGNCTAICPVASDATTFPRKMITYAQLGLEGKLLESPDMWLCDYCGECTRTCPRQAKPSEFMMAVRRFAISKYTPTPLARALFTSKSLTLLFMALAALLPLGFLATLQVPEDANMFAFIPEVWIHYSGIALGIAVGLALLVGALREFRWISNGMRNTGLKGPGPKVWLRELVPTAFKESLVQSRSAECKTNPTLRGRLAGRWFDHMMIFWGFAGLLVSTLLRYLAVPTNGNVVPPTDPVRLLGTLSGLILCYGTLAMIGGRLRKSEASTENTLFTDWVFLILLFFAGLSGFVLEALSYGSTASFTGYALGAHLIVVFEVLIMAPFTKFAHVLYRPLAIWMSRAYHRI